MAWYTYIVWTDNCQLYTGVTTNLDRRVYEHNHVRSKASKMCWANRPVMLIWYREEKNKSAAYKAEAQIKKLSRVKKTELIASLPAEEKVTLLRKGNKDRRYFMTISIAEIPPVSKSSEQYTFDTIPSLEEIVKQVSGKPITSDCTPDILAKHKVMLATRIRNMLLEHGLAKGWRIARAAFTEPVMTMTRLDRELTDDELAVLKDTLGYEFDRSGHICGSDRHDHLRLDDGGG